MLFGLCALTTRVVKEGCMHQHTNGQFLAFNEEPEVLIRFFNFFWNGFVYTKIRNPKFDSAMVFEKKKNQAPVLVPKIRLNSDSE